jgi:hypothetical protein
MKAAIKRVDPTGLSRAADRERSRAGGSAPGH